MREAEGEFRSLFGPATSFLLAPELTRFRSIGADFETSRGVKTVDTFDKMGLREDLLRGIYEYGFDKPSAIQQRAVVPMEQRLALRSTVMVGMCTGISRSRCLEALYSYPRLRG